MDSSNKPERKINPQERANPLSKITFWYSLDIIRRAFKKDLTEDDLYQVVSSYNSKKLGDRLESQYREQKIKKTFSIYKLLWESYGKCYLLFGILQLIMKISFVLMFPPALKKLVAYFGKNQQIVTREEALTSGGIVIGLSLLYCIYNHNYTFQVVQLGIKARTAFCSLIYRKCLKLSPNVLSEFNTGKIITLITKDCFAIESVMLFANDMWIGLILIVIVAYKIYITAGSSTFPGIGFFLLVIPIMQIIIGKLSQCMRLKASKKTDQRVQITQEVLSLSAVKLVKMYTWEKCFIDKISSIRRKEVSRIRSVFFLKIITLCMGQLGSQISLYLLIMIYIWKGNSINAGLAYVIIGYFFALRSTVTISIPLGITQCAELNAALQRITKLLQAEEVTRVSSTRDVPIEPLIEMRNITVKIKEKQVLHITDLSLQKGLIILTGSLGSGKSVLLKTLISEYNVTGEKFLIRGRFSYASEIPWLFPASIKQNIIFGESYDEERYQRVLQVCEFTYDLARLDKGDDTLIGDKGVNLSKGQQARINLARALYKASDIYLLDECLSSLDAHVQYSVFMKGIKEFLHDKLCVLVCNKKEFLSLANQILLVKNGSVELVSSRTEFISEIAYCDENKTEISDDVDDLDLQDDFYEDEYETDTEEKTPLLIEIPEDSKNIYHEQNQTGKVSMKNYLDYVQYSGGILSGLFLLAIFISAQVAVSYNDKLLSQWVNIESNLSQIKTNFSTNSSEYIVAYEEKEDISNMYTNTLITATTLAILRAFILFYVCSRASTNIHKKMITNVLHATMAFFDNFLTGNILNRFTKDLRTIDEVLPYLIYECLRLLCVLIGIVSLTVMVNRLFIIPAVIIFTVTFLIRICYIPTGRSLKRLDASTRSPIVGHVTASIAGLSIIRSYGRNKIVSDEFDAHQDLYTSTYHTSQIASRGFGLALDLFCSLFTATVVIIFLTLDKDTSAAGDVGLAITQVIGLTGLLQWAIRQSAELENNMTAVERVNEFISVKQEREDGTAIKNWPCFGSITYKNVSLKYEKSNKSILKHLNFTIEHGQKIGIVGRTGAGKSSIIASLFSLYPIRGNIFIDLEDTKTLPLKLLRSKISIIPEDPVLFTGSVRDNIDPADEYRDDEIFEVIQEVGLDVIIEEEEDIQRPIAEINLSSGERQLLCLARALIQENKITILDEATANMDLETVEDIHRVITRKFDNRTVIIIAHRLSSVMNTDKVMVVHRGRIIEFGDTKYLLGDKKSKFRGMVAKAGLL